MKIDREKLYKLYMERVDEITEICDWKTSFGPEEIVGLISEIIENNQDLINFEVENKIQYSDKYKLSDFTFGVDTNSYNFVRFPVDNDLKFFQDFSVNIPILPHINFYPVSFLKNRSIEFIGDKHGVQQSHKQIGLTGTYGNGSIYVDIDQLPEEFVMWCENNLLIADKK
jgi:hypothetical protein